MLADPEFDFCLTLEKKALEKTADKEIFESIQGELRKRLQDGTFSNDNRLYFNQKGKNQKYD